MTAPFESLDILRETFPYQIVQMPFLKLPCAIESIHRVVNKKNRKTKFTSSVTYWVIFKCPSS